MKTKIVKIMLQVLFIIFLISCNKNNDEPIIFDNSHPLSLSPDVEWAVVNDPYAAYRKTHDWNAETSGHCRKGDVLQVNGKSNDENKNVWYLFEDGWLPASCLTVYSNRLKAKDSAEKLTDNN